MTRHQLIAILLPVAVSFFLSACAVSPKREPMPAFEGYTDNTPVIFVHGLFGAKIRAQETGKGVWPGSIFGFMRKTFIGLGVPISVDTLEPRLNPYEAYTPFYGYRPKTKARIWKMLEKHAGYQRCEIGEIRFGTRCYYFFVYDWRKDLVKVAKELDSFIHQVQINHGGSVKETNSKIKVNLVSTSFGGLVTRYYLAYGSVDVLNPTLKNVTPIYAGKKNVDKVIYIATPFKGSMLGVRALVKGYRFGAAKVRPETVATMASLYYLLPHPDIIWLQNKRGASHFNTGMYDLYNIETWERFQLGIYDPKSIKRTKKRFRDNEKAWTYTGTLRRYFKSRLERGRLFHRALEKYDATGEHAFFGVCELTPYRAVLEKFGIIPRKYFVSFYPNKVKKPIWGFDYEEMMMRPGDNTVVAPSKSYQLLSQMEIMEVCEKHKFMSVHPDVTRNVLRILLTNSTKR